MNRSMASLAAERPSTRSSAIFRPFRPTLSLDPVHPFFDCTRLRADTLRRFEAGAWRGGGFLAGMVAVRLHDPRGDPLGYAGRRLDPADVQRSGKWKWPPGFPKGGCLYNWHRAEGHLDRGLIVVEGFWSVMKLAQEGWPAAVALGGVHVSSVQKSLLARARHLWLFLDGDDVGQTATDRLVRTVLHPRLTSVRCPAGLDPADLPGEALAGLLPAR